MSLPWSRLNRFVWYAGLYAATAAFLKLVGFLLFLLFARTLSVDDYAKFGLLYALQTGITAFSLAGILEAVVGLLREHRSAAERRVLYGAANRVFGLMALVASVLAAVVFFLSAEQSRFTTLALASVLASGVLLAFASLQAQLVRLDEKHVASLLFSFVAPLAGLGGGFLAFVMDRTAESFFEGSSVGVAIALLWLWRSREGFDRSAHGAAMQTRTLALAGAPFVAVSLLGWLNGYGNNYVIHMIFESVEVARFTFALSLSSIMLLVGSALNQVWSPRFYRIVHEESFEQVETKNRQFFRAQAVILGIVGGAVVAVFPTVMKALGGNLVAYQSMSFELALLLGAFIAQSPWWHCQNYYLVHGRGPELMKIMLATSVFGIAVWIALMLALGPIGVYLGFMVQMIVRALGIVIRTKRRWPVTISWEGVAAGLLLTFAGFAVATF